jgi:glycosyltransferase involved in cell wall biosynthesis
VSGSVAATGPEARAERRERPRVVMVSDAIAGRNGVGTYYEDLAADLGDHLHVVELLCPGRPEAEAVRGPALPLPGDPTQRLYLPRPFALRGRLRALAPDVVIVATPGPYGLAGMRTARRLAVPICAGYHTRYDALTDLYWGRAARWASRHVLRGLNRVLFRASARVVANSEEMRVRAHDDGADAVERVGTPLGRTFVETPVLPPSGELCAVCYAGRLAREKGIEEVLAAARELPGIRFDIAGDGPMRPPVERAAAQLPNVRYRGWLSREDVRERIDAAGLLLLPSAVEAFGTIALEAMVRARPVLISEGCGLLEWPELSEGAYTVRSAESLSQALARVAAEPAAARREVARRARSRALAFAGRTTRQWLTLLTRLAGTEEPAEGAPA